MKNTLNLKKFLKLKKFQDNILSRIHDFLLLFSFLLWSLISLL